MSPLPNIVLKWSKPMTLQEAIDDPETITSGVYYMTRRYGSKVTMYYIGKTSGSGVKTRLKQHKSTTAKNYKGEKMVSFARIVRTNCGGFEDLAQVIDDVESVLIYSAQPEFNQKKRATFKTHYNFILKNTGSKGMLKDSINTEKLLEESKTNPPKGKTIDRHRNESRIGWGWD